MGSDDLSLASLFFFFCSSLYMMVNLQKSQKHKIPYNITAYSVLLLTLYITDCSFTLLFSSGVFDHVLSKPFGRGKTSFFLSLHQSRHATSLLWKGVVLCWCQTVCCSYWQRKNRIWNKDFQKLHDEGYGNTGVSQLQVHDGEDGKETRAGHLPALHPRKGIKLWILLALPPWMEKLKYYKMRWVNQTFVKHNVGYFHFLKQQHAVSLQSKIPTAT